MEIAARVRDERSRARDRDARRLIVRFAALALFFAGCTAAPAPEDARAPIDVGTDAPSCAGIDCTTWGAALAIAPRDAVGATMDEAVADCVVQVHQSDCCGARRAYGVNHAARGSTGMPKLCHAEDVCAPSHPSPPPCSDETITVDTGDTTRDASLVRVRGVPATPCPSGVCVRCETIVCAAGDATCLSLEGITATQCGG